MKFLLHQFVTPTLVHPVLYVIQDDKCSLNKTRTFDKVYYNPNNVIDSKQF